jgi:hypothetical protein
LADTLDHPTFCGRAIHNSITVAMPKALDEKLAAYVHRTNGDFNCLFRTLAARTLVMLAATIMLPGRERAAAPA